MSLLKEAYMKVISSDLPKLIIEGRRRINKYPLSREENTYGNPINFPLEAITKKQILRELRRNLSLLDKVGLYIHLPFCNYSCAFCNYIKLVTPSKAFVNKYLDAIKKEIDILLKISGKKVLSVDSIYFGGGTPTYLSASQINNLLNFIYSAVSITSDIEVTFESSPETITPAKIDVLLKCGVNRLSIGIETFSARLLKIMERKHDVSTAISAFKLARRGGFKHINIDLLYGHPEQTLYDWQYSLEEAIKLHPTSIYAYRTFPNYGSKIYSTCFSKNKKINFSILIEFLTMGVFAIDRLMKAGYIPQSLCKFISPEEYPFHRKSHINEICNKIGLGMSARSSLYLNLTYLNHTSVQDYINCINEDCLPISRWRRFTIEDKIALQISDAVECMRLDKNEFKNIFGVSIENILGKELEKLEGFGLITNADSHIKLTYKGIIFFQEVWLSFITRYVRNYLKEKASKRIKIERFQN